MPLPRRISKKSAAAAMNFRKTVAGALNFRKKCFWHGEFKNNPPLVRCI
jgi:hypothetical protein